MTRKPSVTLSDVARRAGVSRTTASYIINGRASQMRISAGAQDRVQRAVAELAYRPNRSAQSLRTSRTLTVGVLSDHVASGAYGNRMLAGAGAAARASDHLLVIAESEGDLELEALLIEEMLERQVDGIVYVRLVNSTVSVPPALRDHRVVLLNCIDETARLPSVLPDERGGGREAASVLVRAGVAGEVWVVGEDPTPNAVAGPLRLDGVLARLSEAGTELRGVLPCPWAVRPAYDAVWQALSEGLRPSGLVCLNDRIAMGAYQALADRGLRIPDDVSVVSFDGSELAGWLRPSLTSVALPFAQLGMEAVRLLVDGGPLAVETIRLPMPLLEGESVRT